LAVLPTVRRFAVLEVTAIELREPVTVPILKVVATLTAEL
jgi:hypothetical protein